MRRPLLTGLTTLTLGATLMVGTLAFAQGATVNTPTRAGARRPHGAMMMHAGKRLQLTDTQRAQARTIAEETRAKIAEVLTPEQRQTLAQRPARGKRDLNLTEAQRAKLQELRTAARGQAKAIHDDATLAPEQKREKLKAHRQAIRTQMQQVLTPEQQARVGKGPRTPRAERPTLTDDQRARLKVIREDARTRFRAILTPEQQAQLDQRPAKGAGDAQRGR